MEAVPESMASRAHMIAVNDDQFSSLNHDMSNKKQHQMYDLNMSHYYLGNEDGFLIQDEQHYGSHHNDSLAYSSKKRGKKIEGDTKLAVAVKKKEVGTTHNSDSDSGSTGKPV